MKYKKMLLAFLVVLTILTIGLASVSAASSDNTDIAIASDSASGDEIVADTIDENPIQESNVETEGISEAIPQEEDQTIEPNLQESDVSVEDDENLQQENQEDTLTFTDDDLKVDFPKNGLIGHGDDRDSIVLNISIPKDSSGKISIYENGTLIGSFDSTIKSIFDNRVYIYRVESATEYKYETFIYPSKAGNNNYTVKYAVDSENFEKSAIIPVSYVLGWFDQSYYGNTALEIVLPYGATGSFNVLIDGKKYATYVKNEDTYKTYFVKLSPLLSIGKHKVQVTYLGDKIYPKKTVEQTLTVVGKIKIPTSRFTNNEVISLRLPAKAKGSLVVKVYNYKGKVVKTFTKKLVKGKASVSFSKEKFYGSYSYIEAKYTGKDYKVSPEIMDEVTINPPIVLTKKMLKGEKKYLSINLPGKKGVLKLYYEILQKDGYKTKVLSKKLVKGKAKIAIPKLAVGTHDLKVKFIQTLKSGKKVSYVYYRQLTVVKPLKITSAKKLYYGTAKVKIQAYKSGGKALAGKYIKIKINKKFVKKVKTNSKGVATFKIPKKYKPKTYKITAIYKKYSTYKKIRIYKAIA